MSDREYLIYRLEQIAQSPLCHDSSAIREAIALMRGQSEVQTLLAEYMREYDNPAPDYTYRHLLRERLFKVAKGPSR